MNKIHVLHVLNSAHGGSAISTFELIEVLKEKGVQSSLICFNNAGVEQSQRISKLVEGRVLFIPLYWMNKKIRSAWWKRPLLEALSIWKTWGGYRYQHAISKFIQTHQINVIHTSTSLNPEGGIAARRNAIPHVWHIRELIGPKMYFQFPFQSLWVHYVSTRASKLIANSSITSTYLKKLFVENLICVIPNGIDVKKFTFKKHLKCNLLAIAMIGNVTSRLKNHQFFIRTVAQLKDNPNVEFRIYGTLPAQTDPYYSELIKMCEELQITDRVRFMGYQMLPEKIMEQIDILFHPTPNESFGRIFIEAMAAGIPVVAVNQGGAVEIINDKENGFLIEVEEGMAVNSIKQLLQSAELRTQMGEKGRKTIEAHYSLDIMSNKIISLYKEVLNYQ